MQSFKRMGLALALVLGLMVPATSMAQRNNQDGLVNVYIGEVNVARDVDVGVAAQVAAQICGVKVGPVALLARQVDRSGETSTVCETDQGPVTIRQN